jgi:glycosyltransferase involved in cell wall biosynthesis
VIDFAVVIPTHRRPDFLAAAVDSVLRQTYPASEVVVVRDGLDTELPDSLPAGEVRVVDRPREGVAAARNAGIAATTAQWVCFLDDDDLWHPERLAAVADHIESRPGCAAVHAGWWSFAARPIAGVDIVASTLDECLDAVTRVTAVSEMGYLDITGRSFDLLLDSPRTAISTATVRRDLLERAGGFPHGYTCAEDWVMAINVARYTEWHYCDRRLSFIRQHAGNNTTTNPTNDIMTLRAIREVWHDESQPTPAHRALAAYALDYRVLVQRTLWMALGRGDVRTAREAISIGFEMLPRDRDRAVALVPPPVNRQLSKLRRLVPRRAS